MRRVDAPEWFFQALATPYEEDEVVVEDTPVHYCRWGARGGPGIVLVHGGAAHAHWWDHVAPMPACSATSTTSRAHVSVG